MIFLNFDSLKELPRSLHCIWYLYFSFRSLIWPLRIHVCEDLCDNSNNCLECRQNECSLRAHEQDCQFPVPCKSQLEYDKLAERFPCKQINQTDSFTHATGTSTRQRTFKRITGAYIGKGVLSGGESLVIVSTTVYPLYITRLYRTLMWS